eukprot:4675842-Prymnesium_polylepis.1
MRGGGGEGDAGGAMRRCGGCRGAEARDSHPQTSGARPQKAQEHKLCWRREWVRAAVRCGDACAKRTAPAPRAAASPPGTLSTGSQSCSPAHGRNMNMKGQSWRKRASRHATFAMAVERTHTSVNDGRDRWSLCPPEQ